VLLASDFLIKYTAGLAGGLSECGSSVAFVTRTHDLEFGGERGAMRSYVRGALGERVSHIELAGRIRELSGLRAVSTIRRSVSRFEPEVVHLQDAILTDPRLIVASRARVGRYALTVHDPSRHPGGYAKRLRFELVRRALIRAAGLIFVHAEALREELIELEAPTAPVVVVPHGVHTPSFSPLPPQPSLLFFGRVLAYKGLDTLLDAMPLVWERAPDVRLTVAGEGTLPQHPVLRDERVNLRHEHIPEGDVAQLYEQSTCVVLPYRQASQSGIGSLAKRHGRGMVVTRVGGLPELVSPDTGRVVQAENPTDMARALIEIVTTRGLADSMGRASAASVAEGLDWKQVAVRTLDAYAQFLPARPQGRA